MSRFARRPLLLRSLFAVAAALAVLVSWSSPAAADVPASRLTVDGDQLLYDGQPWNVVGINAFQATTLWGVNPGCGDQLDDLDALMDAAGEGGLVRVVFRRVDAPHTSSGRNWWPIDRVVQAAEANGTLLSVTLSDQAGVCDDGLWKDRSWYAGGFDTVADANGDTWGEWVDEVVARYATSPSVAIWTPVGEPEVSSCSNVNAGHGCFAEARTCPSDASAVLTAFLADASARIKAIDADALVASGVIGAGQCGAGWTSLADVYAAVDIATYHDYWADDVAWPAALDWASDMAQVAGRPLLVDEVGISGRDNSPGCRGTSSRAAALDAKFDAGFAAGVAGFAVWNWSEEDPGHCDFYLRPADPAFTLLGR